MRQATITLLENEDTDANVSSAVIPISQIYKVSAQIIAVDPDTNIDGTLTLEVSNDKAPAGVMAPFTPTNWSPLVTGTAISAAGISLIPATDVCFEWLRATYTDGSSGASTGTISVNLNEQGF